eukprot:7389699-Prymnesium_polylepis.1
MAHPYTFAGGGSRSARISRPTRTQPQSRSRSAAACRSWRAVPASGRNGAAASVAGRRASSGSRGGRGVATAHPTSFSKPSDVGGRERASRAAAAEE